MSRVAANDVPPDLLDEERDEEELAPEAGSGVELDFEATPASIEAGTGVVRRFWATLPPSPGVYRMIDRKGDVLYVGKAKSLKARVGSYVRGQGHSNRIIRMIAETASMEFVTTATETEALLLEANLIKQLRPRYNVVLRDDKSLPYILLTADSEAPQVVKHRGARNRRGFYFGPFASVWAVNRTINALQRAFLLRSCSDSYYENRTRPCLLFQIKRCSGPCTGEIDLAEYGKLAEEARAFLSGRSSAVKERLAAEMNEAAEELEFERAARYRDRLAALSAVQSTQGINTQNTEEADIVAIDEQAGQFCVEVFFFRNHQNWGNRAYFPKADRSMSRAEVLGSFVSQFYDDKPPPRLVLLSEEIEECALVAAALTVKAGRKVEISVPQRGERRQLVEAALRNAREALGRRLAETSSQAKLLAALGAAFGLASPPRRIEVYDNSHIMGTNAVGAMIVAGPGGLMKTHYRTFNMRSEDLTPGDDYAMMREMLRRRFARLVKESPRTDPPPAGGRGPAGIDGGGQLASEAGEPPSPTLPAQGASPSFPAGEDPETFPAWPDLVLIDGGRGQLEAARAALAEVGATGVPIVGVAKGRDREAGRETFFMPGREPIRLPPRDPALYFVQRLRDEAHRFAIGAHRAKRKRELTRSPLDEIPGIGPARKRALLHHFGTMKAIERAALDDLMRAPGVNAATARTVYDYFRGGAS
ncbi:excinuclease ABC subunit UvrC [Enterovirga aerilata]|uniref:UvrABC system protein C n=1 Tax=Enterovirga aerilata TaxID=2730920 RepID=A0A849I9D3_9HYPH|nr:excinuclease ABC subunit UvrC [Enterovirga sp. DB1703]NNM73998.1 excinuclease ABC subunit UvrC [Enterovirga sp. DB1703]